MNEINIFETKLSTSFILLKAIFFTLFGIFVIYPNFEISAFALFVSLFLPYTILSILFLKSKVIVTEKHIRIKYNFVLFFLKPIEIRLDEIELIKISNVRRKFHFPFLKIDFNNGNKSRTYFLTKFISEKSIDKLRWALRSLKIKED